MMEHVEMIVDYVVVGEDFQYSDNHGILTRCRDCKHYRKTRKECGRTYTREWEGDERNYWTQDLWTLKGAKMEQVDGERIKADTWYTMKNGEFVECE